jgi:hypothetical protein
MPAEEARTGDEEIVTTDTEVEKKSSEKTKKLEMKDPIDMLTVPKLKDILKREGLKVSGSKEELQDRLKIHVKTVVKKNKDGETLQ